MNTTSRVIPPDYFVLLTLANEVVCRVEQGSLRLQSSVNTGPGVPERNKMVGQPYQKTGGPWSNRERRSHINCLKLKAATLAIQTFAENRTGIFSSPHNRQHNSGCLHQQLCWNCFKGAYNPGKESVDVVSGKEHTHHSPTPPRIKTMIDLTD